MRCARSHGCCPSCHPHYIGPEGHDGCRLDQCRDECSLGSLRPGGDNELGEPFPCLRQAVELCVGAGPDRSASGRAGATKLELGSG